MSELWQLFNAHPQPFYGVEVALCLLLAGLSGSDQLRKMAFLLLVAFGGENWIEVWFKYDNAPPLIALMNASLCLATVMVAWQGFRRIGFTVGALYWIANGVWWVAIWERTPSAPMWYVLTNGVFFVQVLITGVASGGLAYMAHSRHRRDLRFRGAVRSF